MDCNCLLFVLCSKEKTGVDRFSLRQAVIFLCATNRPDELDLDFVRPGRIDRKLYIGLPDAKQRIQIFGVHSSGKQLAEDVDFGEVSYLFKLGGVKRSFFHQSRPKKKKKEEKLE